MFTFFSKDSDKESMEFAFIQKNVKILAINLVIGVIYFATAKFGLKLDAVYGFAALVWAPSGIALAALIMFGLNLWPAVFLAAALVNLSAGASLPEAGVIAVGNTLEALVAAILLKRSNFKQSLSRFRDVLALVCYGALLSTALSASIGTLALVVGGKIPVSGFRATWVAWWMGDMTGDLIIAPFLLICREYFRKTTWRRLLEALVLALLLALTMVDNFQGNLLGSRKLYFVFPFMLWASIRFRQPGAVGSLLLILVISVTSAVMGFGQSDFGMALSERLLNIQTFLAVVSVTTLSLAAIVTESDRAKRSLKKAELAAREASELKSEFLANMSHEVRTPLTGILGLSDLLIESKLNKKQTKMAKLLRRSGQHLLSIVNKILDFSKIEAGKLDLELSSFSVRTLIKTQIELLSPKARKKGVLLVSSVSEEIPSFLKGDRGKLTQILLNLIGNAIKFTEKGKIKVKVRLESPIMHGKPVMIRFSVSDTGLGIPSSVAHVLFQPFSQADSSASKKFGGTGLGLAICKRLVERMDGRMGFQSEEGKGSEFWFVVGLEAAERAEIPREKVNDRLRQAIPQENRILVAEDDLVSRLILEKQLEKLGYHPHIVASGREVLEVLQEGTYDLVFLDCQMPEMDGFTTAREIRNQGIQSEGRAIPIIAFTAYAVRGDQTRCFEAGMDDYISKPTQIQELEAVLKKWLKRR